MTIDQVAILWLEDEKLGAGGKKLISPAQAAAQGLTDPDFPVGKSAVQIELERQANEKQASTIRSKRRRRRGQQEGNHG